MTPTDIAALDPAQPWDKAYPYVERKVRDFLTTVKLTRQITTAELVAKVFGEPGPHQPSYQRQRAFKALSTLAYRELADCCTRGEARVRGKPRIGKRGDDRRPEVRPWLWHAPGEPHFEAVMPPTCPHCGGLLPVKRGRAAP